MGLFFADRSPRGPDPYVQWKAGLFVAGAVAAILGMTRNWPWLLAVAASLLGAGFLLRFLPHRDDDEGDTGDT